MTKSYELFLHYKQGDDFQRCLGHARGNVPTALRLWAETFKRNHDICLQLARVFEGKEIDAHADTHHISFEPGDHVARGALEVMAAEKLIEIKEWPDEDEDGDVGGEG